MKTMNVINITGSVGKIILLFIFSLFLLSCSRGGQGKPDQFPNKPISLVVSYSAGGATDFQARIVTIPAANKEFLGTPFVILNKPGAGGQIGWNWFASKAKADGYTLSAYNVPHFIAQSIVFKESQYNINNLEPIANWGADPAVLIVGKDSPFNTIEDLVQYAKANPGKVTFSGAGLYVGHHIAFLQLAKVASLELKYVPAKGGVGAMRLVISNKVMAGFNNLSDSFRSRDKIKILAIADLQRNKEFLPDVPTFKERNIDIDDSSVNFRGIMAKKGTPINTIEKLAKVVPEMFKYKRVAKRMKVGGSPMRILTRDQVIKMWREREAYLKTLLEKLAK